MRRIALLSDIHGNSVALDAVLAPIAQAGIAEVYCLGDLVGYGPDPEGVVERLRSLGVPTIQGNYDEGVGTRRGECGCYYATDAARSDGAASYAFTDSALSDEAHAWLAALPSLIRIEEAGARVLLVHGSPRKVNEYLLPDRTDRQLLRLADEAGADLVCHGHVHLAFHRRIDAYGEPGSGDRGVARPIHYVSTGSVGKPKDGDPRACWVELVLGTAGEVGPTVAEDPSAGALGTTAIWAGARFHRVPYDIESVARAMEGAGLPETLIEALRKA